MQLDLRHRVAVHLAQEILRQFVRQANPLPLKVNSDRSSAKGVTVCRQADHFSNLFGCQGLALHERIRNCSDLPPAVFYETPSLENSDVQPSRGDFVRSRDVAQQIISVLPVFLPAVATPSLKLFLSNITGHTHHSAVLDSHMSAWRNRDIRVLPQLRHFWFAISKALMFSPR